MRARNHANIRDGKNQIFVNLLRNAKYLVIRCAMAFIFCLIRLFSSFMGTAHRS
nr:MAG TPA: hypothetical protein [Caudoviricetes sp.]